MSVKALRKLEPGVHPLRVGDCHGHYCYIDGDRPPALPELRRTHARLTEAILLLAQCRTSVSEIYQLANAGTLPGVDGWRCGENTTTTQYVSKLNTNANGVITVTLHNIDPKVDTTTLTMVPLT